MINELIKSLKNQINEGTLEVVEATEKTGYTPYAISVLLNEAYEELGINKTIKSQMLYNYAAAGRINGVKGMKSYTEAEVQAFIKKMVMKNLKTK